MLTFAGVLFFTVCAIFLLGFLMRADVYRLSTARIALAFSFKILMGCAYGYIFLTKYEGDDTWWLHEYSLGQQQMLLDDPMRFFSELNPFYSMLQYNNWSDHVYYYLADIEVWVMTKPLALINFLTGRNYYSNVVFFNLPVFYAQFWLYRLLRQKTGVPDMPVYLAIFFVPPVVFWLSGLRPDGMLFFCMMLAISQYVKVLQKAKVINLFLLSAGLIGMVIFRSYLLVLLLPALFAWYLVEKKRKNSSLIFPTVYGSCILLFFITTLVSPVQNAATPIVNRQQAFFALEGNTRFQLDTLKPNAPSFLRILPQAANNTFLRPYPWEATGALQYAAAADVIFFLLLLIMFLFRPAVIRARVVRHPLTMSLLFFSLFQFLIIGYIVPFPGAIVRYKVIGELFCLSIMAGCISWPTNEKTGMNSSKNI